MFCPYRCPYSNSSKMDEHELHRRAQEAVKGLNGSQNDVARALDVNPSSVSRALRNTGMEYVAMQARILSLLEGAPVQRRSTYEGTEVQHEWIIAS